MSKHAVRGFVAIAIVASAAVPAVAAGAQPAGVPRSSARVCAKAPASAAACHAHVVTDARNGRPLATTGASGYGPASLQSAYALTAASASSGTGRTIAIIDAFDQPNVASDLAAYRSNYGLPPLCSSTVVTGCAHFTKVNQNGLASPLPVPDIGWGQEISIDVDMASAICPLCDILLVESDTNSFANLIAAVQQAARTPGVAAISNSYGGGEFSSEGSATYDGGYNHPGIAVTVSSGDAGYGVEFPAASEYVTAVGGTSLTSSGGSWSETAWSGAGSGCSAYITTKPAGQPTIGGCSRRIVADVSAVADPNTGVAVYDSYGSTGGANWYVFGGTSVAAPIIGSVYALAGTGGTTQYNSVPYARKSYGVNMRDVTSGSNGRCTNKRSGGAYPLCNAVSGFDGPTGLGTPLGTGAF